MTEVFAGYEDERLVWEELMRDILRSLGDAPTLEAFLQELQMRSKESLLRPNTITLMTIHGAKGLDCCVLAKDRPHLISPWPSIAWQTKR